MNYRALTSSPHREYAALLLVAAGLVLHIFWPDIDPYLMVLAVLSSLALVGRAAHDLGRGRISIDVFNLFAIGVSLATGEALSAAFIVLMINSADILEWYTARRSQDAVEALLKLKPQTGIRLVGDREEVVPVEQLKVGDIVRATTGQLVAVDGIVLSGKAMINEALVTGESMPVEKMAGSRVVMSTVVDTGSLKIRTTHVGKDSTLERMAELMRSAAANKSKPERLADRFAAIFLPVVVVFGVGVYLITHNLRMTAAIFLVACADDMAVAIPLAMTASLGKAAKRGVIIKGGAWLHTLSRVRTLVLDKTGTLTYGNFRLERITRLDGIPESELWRYIGVAEKFSEHPVGRALLHLAQQRVGEIPDPDEATVIKGAGVRVTSGAHRIVIGDEKLLDEDIGGVNHDRVRALLAESRMQSVGTSVVVIVDDVPVATISLADAPRPEALASLSALRGLGIKDIIMFTGDNERTARRVADQLGITHVRADMKPADKLRELEAISVGPIAMVGDGINDAPSLARADVGIAMGRGGTAIASEAADVIILNDNLSRLADLVSLGRTTVSVINWDIAIWVASNAIGFALVLTGIAGPAFAAFYNFATDFLPLINSSRLFRSNA